MALCLSAITVAVFANSNRFVNQGLVVEDGSGGYRQISNATLLTGIDVQTSPSGSQMQATNQSGTQRNVFFYNGSTYAAVYSNGTW